MSNNDIYRETILDHYRNPRNKGRLSNQDVSIQDSNPLCGDEIEIHLKVEADMIKDIWIGIWWPNVLGTSQKLRVFWRVGHDIHDEKYSPTALTPPVLLPPHLVNQMAGLHYYWLEVSTTK
jgi:hypothetical protein